MSSFYKRALPFIGIWAVLCVTSIFLSLFSPIFFLNENQILYIFSAAPQVIAGIYGLIVTGYVFLRNELDRKATEDESYDEIIQYLKKEYFASIVYISVATLSAIILSLFTLASESSASIIVVNLAINIAISTILIELVIIVGFVIQILDPKSLEVASNQIMKAMKAPDSGPRGSLEEFMKYYNLVNRTIEKYGNEYMDSYIDLTSSDALRHWRRNISKVKLVKILYSEGKISDSLRNRIINLISFRNTLIHGTDLAVSEDSVVSAKDIYEELSSLVAAGPESNL